MPVILLVFFLSGAVSLAYEVIWMRQLVLIFGATTYAVATVLAIFMGGLALGSFVFGRWSDRVSKPLILYAAIEVGIGVYGFLISDLFELLRTPSIALYRLELPHSVLITARGLLSALVLLPPTVLMGGTLPLLASFLIRLRGDVGRQTSLLYFVNTAGAVAGCVLAGFYLIENLGIAASIEIAVATNCLLAIVAVAMNAWFAQRDTSPNAALAGPPAGRHLSPGLVRLAVLSIGVSGFTSLAYESLWTRALLRYLYNSTYAFTTMLAVFLAGIALGSWLYMALPYRKTHPIRVFAVLEVAIGVGFLLSAHLFEDLWSILSVLLVKGAVQSFADSIQTLVAGSVLILFFPALCLGATVPLATEICTRNLDAVGRAVGRVYAVNTGGAILGTLILTFVLIPAIGMHGSLLLLIGMNLAIGAALLIGDLDTVRSRLSTGVAFGAMFLAVALAMPSDLFRRTFSGLNIVFYQEGVTDTVGVAQSPNGQRIITYEDQRGTAGTNTYPHNYLLGHLPFLLHDGQPKLGLHICFGVGNSLSAMTRHASIERIDSVELSPHALDAAAYFWTNDGVIDHPKVRMITDDGRNFVMATEETYDVIELEPPETFTAGVINLYTLEFYRDVAARLNDDGVFVQWLPIGQGPVEQEKMLFRAFFDVFPHGTVWQQLKDGPFLLVGTKSPLRIDYEKLRGKLRDPTVRRDLASADIRDAEDLLRLFVLGPEALRELVRDVPPTTDDRTVLDFSMPRYVGSGFGMGSFRFADETVKKENRDYIWTFQSPVVEHLTNTGGDGKGIQRRVRARPMPAGFETWNPKSKAEWTRWISDPR